MALFRFFNKKTMPLEGVYGESDHLPLHHLLQQIAATPESRLLVLRDNGNMALISFQDGNILDATYKDLTGEDALAAILLLPPGKYEIKKRGTLPNGHVNRPAAEIIDEIQILLAFRNENSGDLPGENQNFTLLAPPQSADVHLGKIIAALQGGAVNLPAIREASGLSRLRCEVALVNLLRQGVIMKGQPAAAPALLPQPGEPAITEQFAPPFGATIPPPAPDGQPNGRQHMQKDPIKSALWGMIVGNIENMGIYPVLQGGEAIARSLSGEKVLEKLAQIDGDNNYEITKKNGLAYVVIKTCPFTPIYKEIPPWGEKAQKLVAAYNQKPDGGGALHPLCIVHKGIRNALKAGIVSIACRSGAGKVEIAERSLEKASISPDEVRTMLEGKGCLFAIPENDL